MLGLPHLLGVAAIVTGISGCALLDLLLGVPPVFPNEPFPSFPTPSAEVTFTTGQATLVIDGEEIELTRVVGAGTFDPLFGTHVTWTNDDGWYLTYYAYAEDEFGVDTRYLSIDLVSGHEHWVANDPTRCVTTTSQADAGGLAGSAACRGLRWSDYFNSFSMFGVPLDLPNEAPFDADVTFEAR